LPAKPADSIAPSGWNPAALELWAKGIKIETAGEYCCWWPFGVWWMVWHVGWLGLCLALAV